jgi:TRAP-type mannitol/chloroaromatic compound transport system permease large subunit
MNMSIELTTVLLFGGLLILLALGVPVVFALGGISVLITFLTGDLNDLYIVATTTYRQITDPGLITIPLFLLMGNFLIHSGISDRLFRALNLWLSGIRGGLALVSVGVCVALAMCGGFGPGILTMGLIAVPAMLKQRYNKSLALGSVMAGGVLGEIIPPSIIMIIFAYISRISIGKIFFGGAIPGFITASLYIIYILVICYLKPELAPRAAEETTWKARWISLKDIVLPFLLVVLVLQDMVMGIVQDLEVNRWLILAVMQIILLIFGMFMDDYAVLTICAPIFIPIAVYLGFDPVWFSIVFILNMQVAYLTPPFGWALILMKGVAPPEIHTKNIWQAVPPFVAIQLIVLIITMLFPQLALWLPAKML